MAKLRRRKSTIRRQEEEDLRPATEGVGGGASSHFDAPIDGELAEKLRQRQCVTQRQEEQGPMQREDTGSNFGDDDDDDDEDEPPRLSAQAQLSGDNDELVRKLAQRRVVVDAEGDCFLKDRRGGGVRKLTRQKDPGSGSKDSLSSGGELDHEDTEASNREEANENRGGRCGRYGRILWRILAFAPLVALVSFAVMMYS